MKNLILIISGVLLNCAAQLAMKKGMIVVGEIGGGLNSFISAVPQIIVNIYIWIAIVCYFSSMALWLVVLSRVDVSFAYPFLSIGYVVSAIAGYYFFNEDVSPVRIAGIAVICVGVILVSRS